MVEADIMSKSDRDALIKIIRQRERLAKTQAKARSAEMAADFQRQLAATYHFDQSDVWKQARDAADRAIDEANRAIAAECERLGIPVAFAPYMHASWYDRGENASKTRRSELTRVANAEIAAAENAARTAIELRSVELQEQIMTASLTSGQAREFLANIPTVEQLMPAISVDDATRLLESKR